MTAKTGFTILSICIWAVCSHAQVCPTLGQNPATSFPVCGTATFVQNSVPICAGSAIPGPCGAGLFDKNPFWYRFRCYAAGTLGFLITPNNLSDDYDWQLFDVTGRNPDDVYTDASLFVACNWSGFGGVTGASPAGTSLTNCAGNVPIFSSMPILAAGHDYLLMVSHYTNSQSGYQLSFSGGTAAITDPSNPVPELTTADVSCDATQVTIRFNKSLRCNSVAANGSDFIISPSGTIISATGNGCTSSFDLDSITITLASPLAPGNYVIKAASGTDGNTLMDNCDRGVVVGDDATFTVNPSTPLPMGVITPPPCAPVSVTLSFTEPIKCNSIAANGSDFTVTGPSPVIVTGATAVNCVNGETNAITLQFSSPVIAAGTYVVKATAGSDGNTLIGLCNRAVIVGDAADFPVLAQPALAMPVISATTCTPVQLDLVFPQPVNCNSIASNGSDFIITGPGSISVLSATATNCNANGQTTTVTIALVSPMIVAGTYQVVAAMGSDGNTIVGDCGRLMTVGAAASYTLPPQPALPMGTITQTDCAPSSLILTFTDLMDCTSISADGSEFQVTGPSNVVITGATGQCNTNQRTITIQLSTPIVVSGNYQLTMRTGSDGNTIRGDCNRFVAVGDSRVFNVPDAFPVIVDSIVPVTCSPSSLRLVLDAPVRCGSIAQNGSDFIISGPPGTNILSATGSCNANGLTSVIDIQLNNPITIAGNYTLQLVTGTDGNTLLSECYRESPAASLVFTGYDTVSAVFQHNVQYDCETDEILFTHDGANGVTQWNWTVNGNAASTLQNFSQTFSASSQNSVTLEVSNGVCTNSHTETIVLDNKVTASFDLPAEVCPEDSIQIINTSTGQVDSWAWSFGNGNFSQVKTPGAQVYPTTGAETVYMVSLTAGNSLGCVASLSKTIKVFGTCIIAVPTAFTPNGDGLNDFLFPLNAIKAEKLDFRVFNRWGLLVFQTNDWTRKWDGRIEGLPQPTSVYVWTLTYTDRDTKVKYSLKGTSTLIR